MTNRSPIQALALFIGALAAIVPVQASAALPSGPVVVAKTTGNAIVIWQATEYVTDLMAKHEPHDKAIADLESAALQILASRKAQLDKAASASIKVMYARTAANDNPQYAPTSFAGFHQLVMITATKSALATSEKWPPVVDPTHLPPGVAAENANLDL